MTDLCKHGFPNRFSHTDRECPYDQPDGSTVTDLTVWDVFQITGRAMFIVENLANKKAIVNRVINLDGKPYKIIGFMSCLIPGHDEGHCTCFTAAELLGVPESG